MALEMSDLALQSSKTSTVSIADLWKDISRYRAEVAYFRTCYKESLKCLDDIFDICQDLDLIYHLEPEGGSQANVHMRQLIAKMKSALQAYGAKELEARYEWLRLWNIPEQEFQRATRKDAPWI